MFEELTQVGKHSIVYSAGVLLQRVASFILVPLYTLYFATSDYGQMDILSTTSSLLTTFLGLGMIAGMYRIYFKTDDEDSRLNITKTALFIFITTSSVLFVFIIFARPLSSLLLGTDDQNSLVVLVLMSIMLGNLLLVPYSILRAKGQSVRYVVYSLIQFFVNVGFTIYLVVIARHGIRGNFEGLVIGQIVVLLFFSGAFINMFRAHFSWDAAKEMLSFGLPLVPAAIAATSMTVSDRYFLRAFSTFDEIGVYALGYKIGMIIQVLIVTPFILSWGPVMWSVSEKPYAKRFYAKVLTYFLAIALFITLALSILSPEILRIISQREAYWRAWMVVPFIALSYLLYGLYAQVNVGISLRKKTQYIPFIVIGAAALNLLLNFLLIPRWGMMGAAVATVLSYFALLILTYMVSQRLYPVVYEWRRIIILLIIFSIISGMGYLVTIESLALRLGMKGLLLLLFPTALLLLRFFTPEEITRFRELLTDARQKFSEFFRKLEVF